MADMLALGAERRKRWRLRHEEFLHIVLSARAAKRAEQGEEPVFIEPLPAEVTQAGLVLCRKCGRRFSEGVFEKHKDLCKELRDAQATDLTEEQKDAKARFLQRMKYSHRVYGRATQQDSTHGKEASTSESRTENHPTLSCAAEMQKIQFLLNDIIPTLSNVPDRLQSSSAVDVFLKQLLPAGIPPSRDESLLQVSNCNKTIMPNCELAYPPESDSRSVSQLFCARNNLRDSNISDNLTNQQSQKSRQSESHCETVPGLVARQDAATVPSAEKNCMRPIERCPLPPVEICFKEAQEAQRSSLSRPNTASSPVFYQFVKATEAGDRSSSGRCQGGLEKPVLPPSPCDPISVASVSFMSVGTEKTNNSQYMTAEATDQCKQSAAASPANSHSLVYLDVESVPSNDVSVPAGNVLKPSTYSSGTYKPSNLTSYALGSVTSTILTQTLRSDSGTSKSSRDGRPFALNEQAHLTEKGREPNQGGPPTKTTTILQNISISDSTESLAYCKFCSQCGERFFDDAKFCVLCGTSRRFGRQHSLVVTADRPKVSPASGLATSS
ncbi:hypothetical protein AAHC03_04926 [Spirometra sp. Aus1]